MVIATWNRPLHLDALLRSLLVQTMPNWEAIVVSEPGTADTFEGWNHCADKRIRFMVHPKRMNDWGNTAKEWGSKFANGDFIVQTNDDNYYVPTFFEQMIVKADATGADFIYCNMIHNYTGYKFLDCEPVPGRIDGGGWMARRELVNGTPWPDPKPKAMPDGVYAQMLATKATKVFKHDGVLFVHN